ncbi:MAG: hypothetical protein HDT24_01870 [Ruminococcus sp.]|nr:hypothetical protein [Ruminococcus sp.]
MGVPPVLLMRKRMIIKRLSECGAFSEESAVTFKEAGVFNPNAFLRLTKIMEKRNILTQTKDGKYYLNK